MADNAELKGARVLVVEDEALIAMLIEDFLGDLGCEVVGPAANIDDANALIGAEAFDFALLDLNLGRGQTSHTLADQLRTRDVPFAFVTGLDAGALADPHKDTPLLRKPFRMDDLLKVLTELANARDAGG